MKLKISFFFVFLFTCLSAEEIKTPKMKAKANSNVLHKPETKFTITPYGHLTFIFPGYGIAFRGQQGSYGVQFDISTYKIHWAITSNTTNHYNESIAFLIFPEAKLSEDWSPGGWTIGLGGIGLQQDNDFDDSRMLVGPFSIGYQGKFFLFDFGVSKLCNPNPTPGVITDIFIYYPKVKFGICF